MEIIDLEPVLEWHNPADRFVRRIPDPGTPTCGARPTPAALADVDKWFPRGGMTPCIWEPGHHPGPLRERVHESLIVTPSDTPGGPPTLTGWRWIATRQLGEVTVR